MDRLEMHRTNAASRGSAAQLPSAVRTNRSAACEQEQQLIGKNRQLMRISDNLGHQGAVSGVADVASLFSEARAWSPCGFGFAARQKWTTFAREK